MWITINKSGETISMPINEDEDSPFQQASIHIIACGNVAEKTQDADELNALKELVQIQIDDIFK